MNKNALIIGNSDGIGMAFTKRLLSKDWHVIGISRSPSSIEQPSYTHHVCDVRHQAYKGLVQKITDDEPIALCVFCVGIGEILDISDMAQEPDIIDVNLTAMVRTAAVVIPSMARAGTGHFMGISSLADDLLSSEAPSYHASKSGFSVYLESMALALRSHRVYVTNVRFGFVDTKMAKGHAKPMMMSTEKAAAHLETCMRKKPVRYTAPRIAVPLVKFRKIMMRLCM